MPKVVTQEEHDWLDDYCNKLDDACRNLEAVSGMFPEEKDILQRLYKLGIGRFEHCELDRMIYVLGRIQGELLYFRRQAVLQALEDRM